MKIDIIPNKQKYFTLGETDRGTFVLVMDGMTVNGQNIMGADTIEPLFEIVNKIVEVVFVCESKENIDGLNS